MQFERWERIGRGIGKTIQIRGTHKKSHHPGTAGETAEDRGGKSGSALGPFRITWKLGSKAFRAPESILRPGSGRRNFGAAASAVAVQPRPHGTKASPAAGCGEEQRQQAAAVHGRGRGQRPGRRRPKRLAQPQAPWPRMEFEYIHPPATENLVSSRRARKEREGKEALNHALSDFAFEPAKRGRDDSNRSHSPPPLRALGGLCERMKDLALRRLDMLT